MKVAVCTFSLESRTVTCGEETSSWSETYGEETSSWSETWEMRITYTLH